MNSIKLFHQNALKHPDKMAVADIKHGILSFNDIANLSGQVQALMRQHQLTKDDSVLVAVTPSPMLYGILCGLMGLGIRIVFIEPWLSLERINHVIETTKPKVFLTSFIGKVWGIRSKAIRNIPHWLTPSDIKAAKPEAFSIEELESSHHAFIVFSSGTTGSPKGVIRTHAYMQSIYDVFTATEPEIYETPDLIIFPNVALFHLATGRGSVIVPTKWNKKNLEKTLLLCEKYRPQTLSTGPAFIKTLIDLNLLHRFNTMERMVIGGALTDCWILEKLFETFPNRKYIHIYGGSEAEPVSVIDAKLAVRLSREKNYFQTLCIGKIIPQLNHQIREGVLWVTGPNVAGEYIGHPDENKGIKEKDSQGRIWHCMGDKVNLDNGILWYAGREKQASSDFELEQKIYTFLSSSKSFIHRSKDGTLTLIGEGIKKKQAELKSAFPNITNYIESKIIRDKRHRSRIDRTKSLPSGLR